MTKKVKHVGYGDTEWMTACLPADEWEQLTVQSQIIRCHSCPSRKPCLAFGKRTGATNTVYGGEYLLGGEVQPVAVESVPMTVLAALTAIVDLLHTTRIEEQ